MWLHHHPGHWHLPGRSPERGHSAAPPCPCQSELPKARDRLSQTQSRTRRKKLFAISSPRSRNDHQRWKRHRYDEWITILAQSCRSTFVRNKTFRETARPQAPRGARPLSQHPPSSETHNRCPQQTQQHIDAQHEHTNKSISCSLCSLELALALRAASGWG